jgi:hypothetical protein
MPAPRSDIDVLSALVTLKYFFGGGKLWLDWFQKIESNNNSFFFF